MDKLKDRGVYFIHPNTNIYMGQGIKVIDLLEPYAKGGKIGQVLLRIGFSPMTMPT